MVMDSLGTMFTSSLFIGEGSTLKKLVEIKKKEKEEYEKSSRKAKGPNVRVRK